MKTGTLLAWRNLLKYKSFYFLNIAGLSLGMACMLAITLYVRDELEYDTFHEKAPFIYRVDVTTTFGGVQQQYSTTSTPLAEAIRTDIPEAETTARIFGRQATIQLLNSDSLTFVPDTKYLENNFYFADPEIVDIFSFNFVNGTKESAFTNPNQIILSRKLAIKYYGGVDLALGKQILFEGSIPLEVAGVFEDFPEQSTYPIELIAPFENYFAVEPDYVRDFLKRDWMYNPVTTLVLLNEKSHQDEIESKIQQLNTTYADDRVRQSVVYNLKPLLKIHLYDTTNGNVEGIRNVYVFIAVGMLILVIACINFINLSTVHSLKRAKEIGIRKVLGALKVNLANQFLTESLALVFVATMLAIMLVIFLLPQINTLSGKNLTAYSFLEPRILALLIFIFIATGLAAGLYPSFYITRFNPVVVLKGLKNASSNKGLLLRRMLVVIQFSSSIIMIIITLTIYKQMNYVRQRPLGFQKESMLTIPLFSFNLNSVLGGGISPELRGRMNGFENEVLKESSVEAVTVSSILPGNGAVPALVKTDKIRETDNVFVPVISVDYDFIETYKISLLAGRNFDKSTGTDHLEALIANEEAMKLFGFTSPYNALGYQIEVLGKKALLIGVISNYHFEGLQQAVRPLLLEVNVNKFTTFTFRLHQNNLPASIKNLKTAWDKFFPEKVFEYDFLDDQLATAYQREQRFGNLINCFSAMAIFISSIGLFGLAAYLGHQKRKEAGVRKIIGATTLQVFSALSKEFVVILLIAFVVSAPVAYWLSNSWLDDFAYRTAVTWTTFVVAFLGTAITLFLTTAFQTYKAASTNPVDTLRNE